MWKIKTSFSSRITSAKRHGHEILRWEIYFVCSPEPSKIYDPIPPCVDQMTERALKHTLSIRTTAKSQRGKLLAIDGQRGRDRCRLRLGFPHGRAYVQPAGEVTV